MVDTATLTVVRDIVAILGALIAFSYYIMTLRNQNKTRQAQIYVQIYNRFSDPDFLERYFNSMKSEPKDFEEYMNRVTNMRENNVREYAESISVGMTFEGMGVLVKGGFIDPQYVADTTGTLVLEYWEQKSQNYTELRNRWSNQRIYKEIEYLYDVVSEIVYREYPEMKPQ